MSGNGQSLPLVRLVTGARGAGKTHWCEGAIANARAAGHEVRGLLSPGDFVAGKKIGIRVRDLHSGAERPLARAHAPSGADTKRLWDFDDKILTWANERLRAVSHCHTLVVDEVGPMELLENRGWTAIWSVLRDCDFAQAILTVRPALLETCQTRISQLGEFSWEVISCPIGKAPSVSLDQ